MLMTLIQKEMMFHVLSIRFVALLLMCVLLIPLTLSISYRRYSQHRVDYQEAVKRASTEAKENPPNALDPTTEVSKFFLRPTPLSVFANGLEDALPAYLGMTRNGVRQGSTELAEASVAYAFGNLDFLFIVGTVFSLLALLFTFDAVAGERESGTLRMNLSNTLPRDVFLWSKLIGGYIVFVIPFLVSYLFGLLLLTWQGFPLGEFKVTAPVLGLSVISLLYIAVFFAIGVVISTFLDSSKTALIIAFTFWVFAVLILPRGAFVVAKLVAPTRTAQSVYMEKSTLRNNLAKDKDDKINKKIVESSATTGIQNPQEYMARMDEIRKPIEVEFQSDFKAQTDKIDREYQRQKDRQERLGETLSRLTPTASLTYFAMNLTQTGKLKRDAYFQIGRRYYKQLNEVYFSQVSDDPFAKMLNIALQAADTSKLPDLPPPPTLTEFSVSNTLRRSAADVCLLALFAVAFTTLAFLKFFRSDI